MDIIGVSVDFTNDYTYDALNRLTRITQVDGDGGGPHGVSDKRIDLAYDAAGQYTSIARYEDLNAAFHVATASVVITPIESLIDKESHSRRRPQSVPVACNVRGESRHGQL